MSDVIEPGSKVTFYTGTEVPDRATLMKMIASMIPVGMEIDYRDHVGSNHIRHAPEPLHTVPTEREAWNAAVDARKRAKKGIVAT
jgi:hypothetical protein